MVTLSGQASYVPAGYTTPYTVTASSALSQDYFLTAEVFLASASDQVVPFSRADGTVEALVLSSGRLYYLAHDSSQPSGWSYTPVPVSFGGPVTEVTAGLDASGEVYALCRIGDSTQLTTATSDLAGLHLDPAGTWQQAAVAATPSSVPAYKSPLPMHAGWDVQGNVYFTRFDGSGNFAVITPHAVGGWTGQWSGLLPTWFPLAHPFVDARWFKYSPTGPNGNVIGGVIALDGAQNVYYYNQENPDPASLFLNRFSYGSASSVLAGGLFDFDFIDDNYTQPVVALLGAGGSLTIATGEGITFEVGTLGTTTVDGAFFWSQPDQDNHNQLYLNVVTDQVVSTVSSTGVDDQDNILWSPLIPLEQGVISMCGSPTDSTRATLFVVGSDLTLSVLAKDPALGTWSRTQVQQATSKAQDMTNWRTQLTVLDDNGIPVSGIGVRITSDRTVGAWQPTGSLIFTPGNPVPFTTNAHGSVTLAIPALDLESPVLTAQLLDVNSQPSGSPVMFSLDSDVHAFLAGTAPLNQLGSLSGNALATATDPDDGTLLSPTLAGLSDSDKTSAAGAIAEAMHQTMAAGATAASPAPGPNGMQSFKLDMTGLVATFTSSTDPNDPNTAPTTSLSGSRWWDGAQHDLHSVEHSIRKGITKLTQCTAQFVENAEKTGLNWVLNLALDVENWGINIATFVVTDVKSAVSAVHGIFQAIGVDIDRAIRWIRLALKGLITHVEENAQTMLTLIGALPTQADSILGTFSSATNTFFAGLQTDINDAIGDVITKCDGNTFAEFEQSASTQRSLGSFDPGKLLTDVTHNWLLDKLFSEFESILQPQGDNTAFSTIFTSMISSIETKGEQFLEGIGGQLWDVLKASVEHPADMNNVRLDKLLTAVQGSLDDLIELADLIVQAFISLMQAVVSSFSDLLNFPIDHIPLLGAILKLLGIDDAPTIGHIFSLALMFPTTLAYQLDHDGSGSLFPANLGASDELATPSADWGPALAYTHGIVRIIMAPVTAAGSVQTYYQLDEGQEFPLAWYGWFGVVSNLYLLTTTWPGVKVNGLTPPPYTTAPDTTGLTNELAVGELAASWANPLLNAAAVMCKQSGVAASSVEWMPYVTTIIALGNLILTGIVDVKRTAKPELFAIHMLERTPPTLTPFLTPAVADGSELLTLGLKVFCDIGMNVAAGGLVLDTA